MSWARGLLYAHCGVVIACAASVAYGLSRRDMGRQFQLGLERLLSHPVGYSAYFVLTLSCAAFPLALADTLPRRLPVWRQCAVVVVDLALSLVQFFALMFAYP